MADGAVLAHEEGHDLDRTRKTAMWAFLGSEVFFFGSMISTFLLYRTTTAGGPGAEIFNIPFTSASSFVLLMSSLTMVLADHAVTVRRDNRQARVWLLGTALLGSIFLAGQAFEFTTFAREGLTFGRSPFSSAFYMLTGFHGLHVAGGVLLLLMLVATSLRKPLHTEGGLRVEIIALYWHFVDIVWIVIFTVVYLMQV